MIKKKLIFLYKKYQLLATLYIVIKDVKKWYIIAEYIDYLLVNKIWIIYILKMKLLGYSFIIKIVD